MESTTKLKLNRTEIERICSVTFPNTGKLKLAEELTEGWANSAYLITLEDDTKVVAKIAASTDSFMRYERNLMRAEVEVLRLLESSGFPIAPRVIYHDATKSIIESEYFLMSYIPGQSLNKIKNELSESTLTEIYQQLGAYNREMNEIKGDGFGYYAQEERRKSTWREAFFLMLDDHFADAEERGVQLPVPGTEMRAAMYRLADALDEVTEPRLIIWDLWDGNVMIESNKISGLIDFERAFWGDPLMEYHFNHKNEVTDFRVGYGRDVVTEAEHKRRALYDVYLDLILCVECAYRGYTDTNYLKWASDNLVQSWEQFIRQYPYHSDSDTRS
ncbi:phosphotransferase family protein [Paenibacillus shunpengii]|uniref:Phosphotransferase family protein n=1 Tax=Paenibacillus shunpengii TaxID=2054424 RepID=A0ABW5SUR5_9BACL